MTISYETINQLQYRKILNKILDKILYHKFVDHKSTNL